MIKVKDLISINFGDTYICKRVNKKSWHQNMKTLIVGEVYFITNYNGYGDLWLSRDSVFEWDDIVINRNVFYNFFYTEKEIRKLKLENIESRR